MKKIRFLYTLVLLSAAALSLGSCSDKDIPAYGENDDNPHWEGDPMVIDVNVTLDMMGGGGYTRSGLSTPSDVERLQNYINPEKFRVLFFDENDKFIFESLSRWVNITYQSGEFIALKVSVPFFSYGNDYEYDWDWDEIRKILTKKESHFKIAVLANRPDNEWYPGFERTKWEGSPRWFDNSGPHWNRYNSIAYKHACDDAGAILGEKAPDVKDIFDIHHSQYDPIYDGKDVADGAHGYYSVVMGNHVNKQENTYYDEEPYMSSTSSWVDWDSSYVTPNGTKWGSDTSPRRISVMPSEEHPIPMYGVQQYASVDEDKWLKGTTFVLERNGDEAISLLRSVARLDLLIPDSYDINYVALYYSNVYARCEPMNVWTPTDKIWEDKHYEYNDQGKPYKVYCEEERLVKYGPITENGTLDATASKTKYWEKLAWMYGAWLEKKDVWDWGPKSADWAQGIVDAKGIDPPQIMNACIQRNNIVVIDQKQIFHVTIDGVGYHHIIAYTGERHTNAPSALQNIGNTGSGNPTVLYWTMSIYPKGQSNNNARYSVAIADYENIYGNGYGNAAFKDVLGEMPANGNGDSWPNEPGNNMGVQGSGHGSGFMAAYQAGTGPGPLPIIRNHIYTLKLVPAGSRAGANGTPDFNVEGKVTKSESINFSKRTHRSSAPSTTKK